MYNSFGKLSVFIFFILTVYIEGRPKVEHQSKNLTATISIHYKKYVDNMFSTPYPYSFGIIAGRNEDVATLRIVSLKGGRLKEDKIPLSKFEPAGEFGHMIAESPNLIMTGNRIYSVFDMHKQKLLVEYWGIGNVLMNKYHKAKVIDFEKMLVLTLFTPLYDDNYEKPVNNTYALTIEDLANKKRVKQVPVSTLSGDYKIEDFDASHPDVFFGDDFTIYRESARYDWLCVDNDLNPVEHPLVNTLKEKDNLFGKRFISLLISQKNGYAVAMYESARQNRLAVLSWIKDPSFVPVDIDSSAPLTDHNFTMSPSGSWVFFKANFGKNYLLYLNNKLPLYHAPVIRLDYDGSFDMVTWMTTPEGLVIFNEGMLHYWDLSTFNPEGVEKGK